MDRVAIGALSRSLGVMPLLLLLLLVGGVSSPVASATDPDLGWIGSAALGRQLLEQTIPCPVDMQNLNYTIITSKCKKSANGTYPRDPCCDGYLQLLCPHLYEISNATTDCRDQFYSYLNTYGSYPNQLFGNMCGGDLQGLRCPDKYLPPSPPPSGDKYLPPSPSPSPSPPPPSGNAHSVCQVSRVSAAVFFVCSLLMSLLLL